MSVTIGVHHELDASFNALLLLRCDLIEDGSNYTVNLVLAYSDDSFDHLDLDRSVFRVDFSPGLWVNDRLNNLLDELSVRIDGCMLYDGIVGNLSHCLSEHLFLFLSDSFSFSFLFLAYPGLVCGDAVATALSAPALSLAWSEVIGPMMASSASDVDNGDSISLDNLDPSSASSCLLTGCIDDLDTVVADTMLFIGELPERNLAALAWLLAFTGSMVLLSLLLSSLLDSGLERSRLLFVLILGSHLSCHLSGGSLLALNTCTLLLGLLSDVDSDLSEEILHVDGSYGSRSDLRATNRSILIVTSWGYGPAIITVCRIHIILLHLLLLRSCCCNVVLLALEVSLLMLMLMVEVMMVCVLVVSGYPGLSGFEMSTYLVDLGHRDLDKLSLDLLLHFEVLFSDCDFK